jgi:hypothetical protein
MAKRGGERDVLHIEQPHDTLFNHVLWSIIYLVSLTKYCVSKYYCTATNHNTVITA